MNKEFFLKNLWLWKCGMVEMNIKEYNMESWSWEFQKLMQNRCMVGACRYGGLKSLTKKQYDRVNDIRRRLKKYEETKNKEHLIDIANICMLEFEEGDGILISQEDTEHTKLKI